ncbi:MAG: hypothetical protein ACREPD_01175 [Stenotrophomonas sp.]|uniref:hypothetical protein n=1 Tax=Stenotrophomonas sp. TaxID=69392 RepID=UPI003D6D1937
MQPIGNDTKQWTAVSSATPANDRTGDGSPEQMLALTRMVNGELARFRLIGSPLFHTPIAGPSADGSSAVSAPVASLQLGEQAASHAATSPAAPRLSWLNADGSLNQALPEDLLFRRVVENASDPAIVRAFAEWACEEEFQAGDAGFISDDDAYGISMSVRNEGNFLDPKLQDLAGEAMQGFLESRHRWNDRVVARVVEHFEGTKSTAPGELPGALQVFKHTAYGAMREEAMDILERCARTLVHSD